MSDAQAVEFVAEVRAIRTIDDKTVNVTLNLPEYCIEQAQWFMAHQKDMIKGVVTLEQTDDRQKPTKRF